jgi:hypothetical protein
MKGGKKNRTSREWRTVSLTLRVEKGKQKGEGVTKDDKSLDGGCLNPQVCAPITPSRF